MSKINFDQGNIHVVGANPNGGGVLTYIENLRHEIRNIKIYGYRDFWRFYEAVEDGDTVFMNVVKPSIPFLIILLLFKRSARRIYCGHGLNFNNNKGVKRLIVKYFERLISRLSHEVIVLNERDMILFKNWNVNSHLIPTALRPISFQEDSDEIAIPPNKGMTWVAVGSVESRKDPFEFIRTARKVRAEFVNDKFIWMGSGPLLKEARNLTKLDNNIQFVGKLSNIKLRKELFSADIFICTSRFEVLPISILEAVEAGLLLVIRKYHYSDDIINRFNSSVGYSDVQEILSLRSNTEKIEKLKSESGIHKSRIDSEYKAYIKQMRGLLSA